MTMLYSLLEHFLLYSINNLKKNRNLFRLHFHNGDNHFTHKVVNCQMSLENLLYYIKSY
jgi:hypothetical protein